jgi:hypothetical protein
MVMPSEARATICSMSTTSAIDAVPPLSLVRVEHHERKSLRHITDHADGIVIPARFDAPYWPKEGVAQDELPGMPPSGMELKAEALSQRVPYLLDPETWRLTSLQSLEDRSLNRTARTLCARAVPLPVTPGDLGSDEQVIPLVQATIRMQNGARWMIAPYFKFANCRDRWLDLNLRCLRTMKTFLGDRPFCAWVYVPLSFVNSGDAALTAQRYAGVLPRGATVFLTVCDLDARLSADIVAAYLRTVLAFKAAGLEVVTDRASEISVLAAALGARGGILGTRVYRTAGESPEWTNEFHPKIKMRYLVAGRLDRLPMADARRRTTRGSIPVCRDADCRTLRPGADRVTTRLHNAHTFTLELAHAVNVGPAVLAAEWRAFGLKRLVAWAQALEAVMDLSVEA